MKTQLKNPETRPPAPPSAETSRIAAAISRILLIHRATTQSQAATLTEGGPQAPSAQTPNRQRDATPVEWALRMMF